MNNAKADFCAGMLVQPYRPSLTPAQTQSQVVSLAILVLPRLIREMVMAHATERDTYGGSECLIPENQFPIKGFPV